ncbi:MAG: hypothetical protein DLM60_01580 [Pseudonocardiales bacterium]|nr:MAG: hypothetical protein DLM60_01580 [Pseudonocardiales bacterium]
MPLSPRVPEIGALDLLLSVARLGSLGQAARQHGISQPASGSRIRHLEGLLGCSTSAPIGRCSTRCWRRWVTCRWLMSRTRTVSVLSSMVYRTRYSPRRARQ